MKNIILILIIFFLAVTNAFCQNGSKLVPNQAPVPSHSAKANAYYAEAGDAASDGNYKKAIKIYKLAIAVDPDYIDAYNDLALCYRQLEQLDSAEYYYLISLRKQPRGSVANRNMSVVEEHSGNLEKAVYYNKQALAIDPTDAEAYYGLAREYSLLNKPLEGLKNAKAAEKYFLQKNDPEIADCYFILCLIYIQLKNNDMGKKYMELARQSGRKVDQSVADMLK